MAGRTKIPKNERWLHLVPSDGEFSQPKPVAKESILTERFGLPAACTPWTAILGVRVTNLQLRFPNLEYDINNAFVGNIVDVISFDNGFNFSSAIRADEFIDAAQQSREVAGKVLGVLALTENALLHLHLYERQSDSLTLLRDWPQI